MRLVSEHCPNHAPLFAIALTASEQRTGGSLKRLRNLSPRLLHCLRRWSMTCVTTRTSFMLVSCRMRRKSMRKPAPLFPWYKDAPCRGPRNFLLIGLPTSMASSERSEEHTSELQSQFHLVCRLL